MDLNQTGVPGMDNRMAQPVKQYNIPSSINNIAID
jgi:hypothetical protein